MSSPSSTESTATYVKGIGRVARKPAGLLDSAVVVAVLCTAIAAALNAVLTHQVGFSGDESYYARIANHPAGPHNFPYGFRIGLPYVVHALPFSHSFTWELLALVAAGVAAGALFALMLEFEIDSPLAFGLAVGFVLSPPLLAVLLRNGIEVDVGAIMVIALACLFIVRHQLLPLAITLLVGTTIHEACLFTIPLAYAVWAERLIDRRALRELALVAGAPVLVYIYLRSSISAVGQAYQPGYNGPFFTERVDVVRDALGNGGWGRQLRRVAIVYGPLWIAAPFALRKLGFARRGLVLFGLCVASMTFAFDWGRLIFFAAPVMYVAGAYVLRDRRRLALLAVVSLLVIDLGYAAYMQFYGVKHELDKTGPPPRGPVY